MNDFFAQQDQARTRTRNLVLLLLAGVAGLVALVNVAAALAAPQVGLRAGDAWAVHAVATAATILVVVGGMAWKWFELSAGGRAVALSLGGRELAQDGRSAEERRLRNIVEEMAIASGVPMPAVFVLDEPGINAFAAGHGLGDAAVAVTSGCLEQLGRDELQGVIAHEFSHILNGDMRLNLRMIALVHGLLVLSETGRLMMRLGGNGGGRRRGKDNGNALLFVGLALMVIGWAGWLMAQLVRAAISRQREFLADASAVQFTRNPAGIAGALKRIAGGSSIVRHERAPEAAHLFFGQAVASLFATHPPVAERIRRLEPGWDGAMPPPPATGPGTAAAASIAGFQAATPPAVTSTIGAVPPERVAWAGHVHAEIPAAVATACRDPFAARAAVLACILDDGEAASRRQLDAVARRDPGLAATAADLHRHLGRGTGHARRLATLQLAHAALIRMTPAQTGDFLGALDAAAGEDGSISFDELLVCRLMRARLAPARHPVEFLAIRPLAPACATLVGAMARIGPQPRTGLCRRMGPAAAAGDASSRASDRRRGDRRCARTAGPGRAGDPSQGRRRAGACRLQRRPDRGPRVLVPGAGLRCARSAHAGVRRRRLTSGPIAVPYWRVATDHPSIRVRSGRSWLRIELARPGRLNALDAGTVARLIVTLRHERTRPRPLLLTGTRQLFSVGADVRELAEADGNHAGRFSLRCQRLVAELERWPAPTVALLRGHCLGAGLELALGCDVIAAAPDARLGMPGLALALLPCMGGLRRLAARTRQELVGELFLRGSILDAGAAVDAGLADRIVASPGDLAALLRQLGTWSPAATEAIRAIRLARQGPIDRWAEADSFSRPFAAGECQRRLRELIG